MMPTASPGCFGPARAAWRDLLVDATFRSALDFDGVVVDIVAAAGLLHEVLDGYLRNLDDDPDLAGRHHDRGVARVVADRLAERIGDGALGPGSGGIEGLVVTLHESHVARASYDRGL